MLSFDQGSPGIHFQAATVQMCPGLWTAHQDSNHGLPSMEIQGSSFHRAPWSGRLVLSQMQ